MAVRAAASAAAQQQVPSSSRAARMLFAEAAAEASPSSPAALSPAPAPAATNPADDPAAAALAAAWRHYAPSAASPSASASTTAAAQPAAWQQRPHGASAAMAARLADALPSGVVDDIFAHALRKQTGVGLKYMVRWFFCVFLHAHFVLCETFSCDVATQGEVSVLNARTHMLEIIPPTSAYYHTNLGQKTHSSTLAPIQSRRSSSCRHSFCKKSCRCGWLAAWPSWRASRTASARNGTSCRLVRG
jgi:hypothetical protein